MKSPNFTIFLLVGFHLCIAWLRPDGVALLGSEMAFFGAWAAFLPVTLLVRRRYWKAIGILALTLIYGLILLLIQQPDASLHNLTSLASAHSFPVYIFMILLEPGLFMVSELDVERLPHEFSHWSGLQIFRPVVLVLAGRERILRRLSTIQQTCQVRGIELRTPLQHLFQVHIWIVPLLTATICEAAYAHKYRDMIGSAHRFVPRHPKRPMLTTAQRVFFVLLIMSWLLTIQRFSQT